jgi:hypothetical protein
MRNSWAQPFKSQIDGANSTVQPARSRRNAIVPSTTPLQQSPVQPCSATGKNPGTRGSLILKHLSVRCQRKREAKYSSPFRIRFRPYPPVMCFDDRAGDAVGFCRHERLEQTGLHFLRQADTRIGDIDPDLYPARRCRNDNFTPLRDADCFFGIAVSCLPNRAGRLSNLGNRRAFREICHWHR